MPVRDKQRAQVSLVVAVTPAADVVRRRNELVRTWTLCCGNCRPIANAVARRRIAHAVGVARLEGEQQPAADAVGCCAGQQNVDGGFVCASAAAQRPRRELNGDALACA